jgi:predicted amidohydrolase YtcJ
MRQLGLGFSAILILFIGVSGCALPAEMLTPTPTPEEPTSEPGGERIQYEIEPCSPTVPLGKQADVIFHNGTIITMDEDFSLTQAIAIKGERILATDCDKNILSLKGNETKVIDLAGKTLMPGFFDGHTHIIATGLNKKELDKAQDTALSYGFTSVTEMAGDRGLIETLMVIEEAGQLRLRVNVFPNYNTAGLDENRSPEVLNPVEAWYTENDPILDSERMVRVPGVKVFVDGAGLPGRGYPALSFPYPETAKSQRWYELCGSEYGDLYWSQEELNQIVADFHKAGYSVAFHAMGDQAIENVINAIEFALDGEPNELYRHQIQHNSLIRPDLLERYVALDILASVRGYIQECSLGGYRSYYGPERYKWAANRYALVALGVHVYLETDFGWEHELKTTGANSMLHLYGLVEQPWVCSPEDMDAKHPISVEQALRIMTIESAYAVFQEDVLGSLEAGKFADMIILSDNPLEVDPNDLNDIEVLMTMLGGKTEYCALGYANLCPENTD